MNSTGNFVETVERGFAALAPFSRECEPDDADGEPSLGGKLLFVSELNDVGRALVVAANIAGGATLTAADDPNVQRQVVRDGVVDFLVTSLEEALRILKNEIRKRATVAVCVADSPAAVEREMIERGVLPDLVFAGRKGGTNDLAQAGGRSEHIQLKAADETEAFLQWKVEEAPARWMPRLDAIARVSLCTNSWGARWLRLAARYCGRIEQGARVLHCAPDTAMKIMDGISGAVRRGEIAVPVHMTAVIDGQVVVAVASPTAESPDKN